MSTIFNLEADMEYGTYVSVKGFFFFSFFAFFFQKTKLTILPKNN